MTLLGFRVLATRHARGETIPGFYAMRLRGVRGFMVGHNGRFGDLCFRLEAA